MEVHGNGALDIGTGVGALEALQRLCELRRAVGDDGFQVRVVDERVRDGGWFGGVGRAVLRVGGCGMDAGGGGGRGGGRGRGEGDVAG